MFAFDRQRVDDAFVVGAGDGWFLDVRACMGGEDAEAGLVVLERDQVQPFEGASRRPAVW
ncbi:MAG: hypothetical protein ACXVRK_02450 [Gaiellaceae bacterium]